MIVFVAAVKLQFQVLWTVREAITTPINDARSNARLIKVDKIILLLCIVLYKSEINIWFTQ